MPYLYSASLRAFFHSDVPDPAMPEDVIEVATDVHEAVMEGLLMEGKRLATGPEGLPVAASSGGGS